MRKQSVPLLAGCLALVATVLTSAVQAQERDQPSVQSLIEQGWEIAGYASNFEGRSLILFKHKDKTHLAQCSVLYDVTREERVVTNCYEVR